jgi:hypothetical protein
LSINPTTKNFRALPLIVAWGIWLARNAQVFEEKLTLHLHCATQGLDIVSSFVQIKVNKIPRHIVTKVINGSRPWAYIDGASHRDAPRGTLCISYSHNIRFKVGLGLTSNNFSKLMALKLILSLALKHGSTHLQVFKYSLILIKWI